MKQTVVPKSRFASNAFSIIELLVIIAIITILLAILLPVISRARSRGNDLLCASNMRQICMALMTYAGQNHGCFPTISSRTGLYWYNEPVIGQYLTSPDHVARPGAIPEGADPSTGLAGGVFLCPNDLGDSVRSYSMNFFASGVVSQSLHKFLEGSNRRGELFRLGTTGDSSHLMLLLESWPELPIDGTNPLKYTAQAVVGLAGLPGARFGGGNGITWKTPVDGTPGRFSTRKSQITFYRHDLQRHKIEIPSGRCNFGFADGHVAMMNQTELVATDGTSSYAALWSLIDRDVEHPQNPPTTAP